ncbi:M50 family metallopeptidase [Candidatus Hydrogenosomobacter endosymbioticus]|uniref:Zinc metalloprotease n=1 Tax=Candidatus Hydrogenosomobacter endosymbioticus TaxID=2558174 RepID=A0ABN6L338_9PROT|nr:M50 family metallopeptidase [Candidatus Hydrogenosomobacter endosymbioticus]BDB96336.1 putative zinc metalloprotease [Candidatus Hydrogenosomobacter endosymbioticus]
MAGFFSSLIAFFLVLSPIVLVHELGHYFVARYNGVHVESFSIGFGPKLVEWKDKRGTSWGVRAFLFGGYVKMLADADASSAPDREKMSELSEEEKSMCLHNKKPWQKIAVAAAGPFANYLFAFVIFFSLFSMFGERVFPPVVSVIPGGIAEVSGIGSGDRILSINGENVRDFADIMMRLSSAPFRKNLNLSIKKVNKDEVEEIVARSPDGASEYKWLGKLGITPDQTKAYNKKYSISGAINRSVNNLVDLTIMPLKVIKDGGVSNLSGPLGIAHQAGQVLGQGVQSVLFFVAILSASIGFLNILPIPFVDGGNIVLYIIEWVKGSPLSEKVYGVFATVGIALLSALFLWVTWNDVSKIEMVKSAMKNLKQKLGYTE